MRIVSLEPFITELVTFFGCAEQLVGISAECSIQDLPNIERLTDLSAPSRHGTHIAGLALEDCLNRYRVDIIALEKLKPELILTSLPFDRAGQELEAALSRTLSERFGYQLQVRSVAPVTFEQALEGYEKVATLLDVREKGHDLAQRVKAQVMDWADNFYERMKNKRVTFISSVVPLTLGGRWIADLIKLCSSLSQTHSIDFKDPTVEWDEIVKFKPDVVIVAPRGADMNTSLLSFKAFEKLAEWELLPAVKRGEVIFTEGQKHFHSPGLGLLDSMAIIVSAIAGFESGYITPRDSYFRLRWLEMYRHKY